MSYKPSSKPKAITVEIPANLQYLGILGQCIRMLLAYVNNLLEPEMTAGDLELAVQEIGVNIVQHAYGSRAGTIQATFRLSDGMPPQLSVTFHDRGISFDPSVAPEPKPGELQEHGWGLFLVRRLMDQVEYKRTKQGNQWLLAKNLLLAPSS